MKLNWKIPLNVKNFINFFQISKPNFETIFEFIFLFLNSVGKKIILIF